MIRKVCGVIWRQRNFATSQHILNVNTFQSNYSVDKLYPHADQDVTIPMREPHRLFANAQQQGRANEDTVTDAKFNGHIPVDKLTIKYSRSGGAGGQNVNKVETKVDVRFHIETAEWLPEHVRAKLLEQQKTRISNKGVLIVTSECTRSQIRNFSDCLQKIRDMIAEAERKPKEASAKDKAVLRMRVEKMNRERLRVKKMHSATKMDRQVMFDD